MKVSGEIHVCSVHDFAGVFLLVSNIVSVGMLGVVHQLAAFVLL